MGKSAGGLLQVSVDDPADAFSLQVRLLAKLVGNLSLLDGVAVPELNQAADEDVPDLVNAVAAEEIAARPFLDLIEHHCIEVALSFRLVEGANDGAEGRKDTLFLELRLGGLQIGEKGKIGSSDPLFALLDQH